MTRRDPTQSPLEARRARGLYWLLWDLTAPLPRHMPAGIFSDPVFGIANTHTDPATWHHHLEHYWEESDRWELIPYELNTLREWARDEYEAERKRIQRALGLQPHRPVPKGEGEGHSKEGQGRYLDLPPEPNPHRDETAARWWRSRRGH